MILLIFILSIFSKPNEVREFTHINGKNFVQTEIIILHSQKAMFIPDQEGITQKWEFEDFGQNSYRIANGEQIGVITLTRTGAIMRVGNTFIEFSNHRLRARG